jgi:hypothetical protein
LIEVKQGHFGYAAMGAALREFEASTVGRSAKAESR